MKQWVNIMLGALFTFSALLTTTFAAESADADAEETIRVTAVGMGRDSDAALKSALRNAVSQAVGTLIDTQTVVENDAVIKDQILSHSGGFVEDYTMIGSPEEDEGLVSVKIDAVVKKMNLKRKMEAANIIHVEKIDGKLYTRQIQVDEANAMFHEMLKDFPRNCLKHQMVGKPYYDDKNKRFVIEVETTLDVETVNAFSKKMAAFLEAALPEPPTVHNTKMDFDEGDANIGIPGDFGKSFFHPVFISADKSRASWKVYRFTDDMLKLLNETLKAPSITLDVTIDGDITIMSESWWLPRPYKYFRESNYKEYGCFIVMPMLYNPHAGGGDEVWKPANAKTTQRFWFDNLAPEDVKQIKDVKMRLN